MICKSEALYIGRDSCGFRLWKASFDPRARLTCTCIYTYIIIYSILPSVTWTLRWIWHLIFLLDDFSLVNIDDDNSARRNITCGFNLMEVYGRWPFQCWQSRCLEYWSLWVLWNYTVCITYIHGFMDSLWNGLNWAVYGWFIGDHVYN